MIVSPPCDRSHRYPASHTRPRCLWAPSAALRRHPRPPASSRERPATRRLRFSPRTAPQTRTCAPSPPSTHHVVTRTHTHCLGNARRAAACAFTVAPPCTRARALSTAFDGGASSHRRTRFVPGTTGTPPLAFPRRTVSQTRTVNGCGRVFSFPRLSKYVDYTCINIYQVKYYFI